MVNLWLFGFIEIIGVGCLLYRLIDSIHLDLVTNVDMAHSVPSRNDNAQHKIPHLCTVFVNSAWLWFGSRERDVCTFVFRDIITLY